MLTDDELPLPEPHCTFRWKNGEYKVNRPGIDGVDVYTARQMREYARAVEQAAYAAAIKACENTQDYGLIAQVMKRDCADAIRRLTEQPK